VTALIFGDSSGPMTATDSSTNKKARPAQKPGELKVRLLHSARFGCLALFPITTAPINWGGFGSDVRCKLTGGFDRRCSVIIGADIGKNSEAEGKRGGESEN
jgi:hypothetical protein